MSTGWLSAPNSARSRNQATFGGGQGFERPCQVVLELRGRVVVPEVSRSRIKQGLLLNFDQHAEHILSQSCSGVR
jgi:hypothetical protein